MVSTTAHLIAGSGVGSSKPVDHGSNPSAAISSGVAHLLRYRTLTLRVLLVRPFAAFKVE
ncbi:hypothetical protein [Coleofasciculus sp. E2-BRE-01]|uniref:hypothetical protein n=1 Tax=Coleofasciculus sp. E2-BRE-01 TaxID=3069524 RepID=UPI0032F47A04